MFQSILSFVADPSNLEVVAAAALPVTGVVLAYPIRLAYRRGKKAARKELARQILPVMIDSGVVEYGFTKEGTVGPKFLPITKEATEKDVANGKARRVGEVVDNAPTGNKVMSHVLNVVSGDLTAKI